MRFIIIYERKNRELESAVLLKTWLEAQGHSCKISQFYEASNFLFFFKAPFDVMIVPHLYESASIYRCFSRFGHANYIFNLQYEQVLSKKWNDLGHHNPKGEATKALHMCWGKASQKRLIDAGVEKQNAPIISPLHFDLLRKGYNTKPINDKLALSRKYNLDDGVKWNLFISSFTYADISDDRLKMNESAAGTKLNNLKKIFTDSRNIIVKWFEQALIADKKSLFIYRPHPDELNLGPIKKLADSYDNFYIINELAVKEWIVGCNVIYSWYSTSVVEAHYLNKPYAILRPLPIPDDVDSVLIQKADFITSIDSFLPLYLGEKKLDFAIKNKYINLYYSFGQETPSFMLMEEFFINLITKTKQKFNLRLREKLKATMITCVVSAFYWLYKILPIKLEKYSENTDLKKNIFIRWFFEFDEQIASKEELIELQEKLKRKTGL